MSTQNEEWTKVVRQQRQGRNNNNTNPNKSPRKANDGPSKFTGHNKGDLEGIILTEDGNITQFTELQERLQTIGGSQYLPKVGLSIETLKRLKRVDFAPTKPTADEWTEYEINDKGEQVEFVDESTKEVLLDMYKEELKQSVKDLNAYTKDMAKVYSLALGQIDAGMKEKLKSSDRWDQIKKDRCPVELLKLLRDICFQGSKTKIHAPTNLVRSLCKLLCSRQRTPDCTAYVQSVKRFGEVLETIGGEYICPALIKYELETNEKYNAEEKITYKDYLAMEHNDKMRRKINHTAFQQFLAAIIIEGSDEDTSALKQTLGNQYTLGINKYPTTTTEALNMMNHFKGTKKPSSKQKMNAGGAYSRNRRSEQQKAQSNEPHSNGSDGKEATTFVNKGITSKDETKHQRGKQSTSRQALMAAVANGDDFGHEMDNYFQLCVENKHQVKSHCHVQWTHTDTDGDEASVASTTSTGDVTYSLADMSYESPNNTESIYDTDEDDNWDYWATRDEQDEDNMTLSYNNEEANQHLASECATVVGDDNDQAIPPTDNKNGFKHETKHDKSEECGHEESAQHSNRRTVVQPSVLNRVQQVRDLPGLNTKGRYGMSVAALDLAYSDYQAIRYGVITCFKYSHKVERLLAQSDGRINENWILLDSESSCNLITNPKLVKNIRKAANGNNMSIHCNSGVAFTDQIADLPGFGEVWFYPDGIASVLSLALVSDRFRVTMDTSVDNALYVHRKDGSTQRFGRSPCNLYYHDVSQRSNKTVLTIATVKGNKQQYSDLDVRRANKARKLQETMGFPTTKSLIKMIDNKLIINSGVTRRDILNAESIYGKHSSMVKGKQVRGNVSHMREDLTAVPHSVFDNYKEVTIHADVMTVNGIRFMHTISRHLKFRTARAITNANATTLLDCIKSICGQYKARGFTVTQVCGDNQFECLRDDLIQLDPPVQLYCVGAGQHKPTIERSIRTVKENVRCYFNHVPFRSLPKRCIIELVYAVVFWLNCRTTGVCQTMSARELMTGVGLDAKECKFQFMEPILAHVDDTDNTMSPRAVDALYLRPTGSLTGGFWAYDMNTGKRIHRTLATATPLTDNMVKHIEDIAKEQKCPSGIVFGDREGNSTVLDIDTAENNDDDDASDATYTSTDNDDGYGEDESLGPVDADAVEVDQDPDDVPNPNEAGVGADDPGAGNEADNETEGEQEEDQWTDPVENEGVNNLQDNADEDGEMGTADPPVSSRLRPTVTRSQNKFGSNDGFEQTTRSRSFFTAGYQNAVEELSRRQRAVLLVGKAIQHYNTVEASQVTPQYGVKKGIKLFGEAGVQAVLKELKQIHDRKVLSALDPKTMTKEMVQQALPYLMFLKRKRDTSIKDRGCADGRRQREYIRKEDATSPTVSLYALVLSCIIDAIEGRDVATVDIPGAFLQTDMPEGEDVYIRLDGTMAELLCRVNPKLYTKYILNKNGKKTLFTRAEKAIYGTLRAALLFWEKLYGQFSKWGFEMNPYDPCTVNKVIRGHQCTIVWHVDDLKISHKDPRVVSSVIKDLNTKFGVEAPLTETRGKVHDYVGMTLDYTTPGKVKLHMFDYLEDILQGLPDSLCGSAAATPASDHLFDVNEEAVKLSEDDAVRFHHYVAKLLYMSKRTRPDIQTAVAFLCTRIDTKTQYNLDAESKPFYFDQNLQASTLICCFLQGFLHSFCTADVQIDRFAQAG